MRGKFITFEGIDGAGKSSHIKGAADLLASKGIEVITTREPGGTPLGEKLRALLLTEKMDRQTEALLMFASRQEHLVQVIEPALARGAWVISDRFSDSTFAYQCGGKGYAEANFLALESLVHGHLQPDATFLFDVPSDVAHERIKNNRVLDKFEQEQPEFHERVRFAYLRRATTTQAYRFHMLDATRPVDHVWSQVLKVIESMVGQGGA